MKKLLILTMVSIFSLGCQVTTHLNNRLLYAELMPQSTKEFSNLLLKIDGGNSNGFSYDLFVVNAYQLKLMSTGNHEDPYLTIRYIVDNKKAGDDRRIEYAEIDLPNLNELKNWKDALNKNEPVILYPKPDIK